MAVNLIDQLLSREFEVNGHSSSIREARVRAEIPNVSTRGGIFCGAGLLLGWSGGLPSTFPSTLCPLHAFGLWRNQENPHS